MRNPYEAWNISENDYPEKGAASDKLSFFAKYAALSPSTYNTQPWLFFVYDGILRLVIDRRHSLPVIDPEDRQLLINCSAALYTLELAANYFGYNLDISLFPDSEDIDVLAEVKLAEVSEPNDETKQLFKAITKRQMNRFAFHPGPLPADDIALLKKAASQEGGWLHICDDTQRKALIEMIVEADHIQNANKHFRREIASWMHPRRIDYGDGMPQIALKYDDVMGSIMPFAHRRFYMDEKTIVPDHRINEGSPILAVLGSVTGSNENKVKAGRALMRVMLAAESLGIGLSTLNQPCQVPETRLRLYDELGLQGRAQIVLRLGYPKKKPDQAPRRPYHELIKNDIAGSKIRLSGASKSGSSKKSDVFSFFKRVFLAK